MQVKGKPNVLRSRSFRSRSAPLPLGGRREIHPSSPPRAGRRIDRRLLFAVRHLHVIFVAASREDYRPRHRRMRTFPLFLVCGAAVRLSLEAEDRQGVVLFTPHAAAHRSSGLRLPIYRTAPVRYFLPRPPIVRSGRVGPCASVLHARRFC